MKSKTEYLTFNLPARMAFENITPEIERIVLDSGVQEGLVLVNAMHITASVFIND
ncbi:MAG: YjbQ family protein, partial [Planctomycetales bacterium]|nr:YjbQ family protein [Planctomycetales bacterium]